MKNHSGTIVRWTLAVLASILFILTLISLIIKILGYHREA